MSKDRPLVVGLGELLWDFLPAGKQLGGAPANFAYCAGLLGNKGIVASRVGLDDLGPEALSKLKSLGVSVDYVQQDQSHSTGVVNVRIDEKGQPRFEIVESVAWDYMNFTKTWRDLADHSDAVCFGSLAQRSRQSRDTIRNFVKALRKDAVRIFDVNLRQSYYSSEIVAESLELSNVVKLNHDELPIVASMLGIKPEVESLQTARKLRDQYDLELVGVTQGACGSLLLTKAECDEHSGFQITVADTVGAGDAFTAGLVHEYLRGSSLQKMNDVANRMGAWVSSQAGAMPVPARGLPEILAAFG